MHKPLLLLALGLISSQATQVIHRDPPSAIFASVDLTPQQIAAIEAGRAVAKVLSWGGPSEIFVFGAVHVDAAPGDYLTMARDVGRLKSTKGYLGAGEFSEPANLANLSSLKLDPNDVKALKECREGSCDMQLPAGSIARFHDVAARSDAADQMDALARSMILELLRAYRQGGNAALGEYRDKEHPARVAEQFETMIGRASALTSMLPELQRYLLEYPHAPLTGADSFFYWEKVAFGLKPTIRVNHGVVYRGRSQDRAFGAVAIKQLYASHYFHTALDMSVCVDDGGARPDHGFYLVTLKASEQDGLTGPKGSMLRKTVIDKTRSSLESALASIKQALEQPARR